MMLMRSFLSATALPGLTTADLAPVPSFRVAGRPPALRAPLRRGGEPSEKRLLAAAAKGKSIAVGSRDRPYEPAAAARSPWRLLRPFHGLTITITTRSPEILRERSILAELDRRHAVTVDVVIADPGLDTRAALRTVRGLAGEGLTTRVVVRRPPAGRVAEARLRRLFEAARRAGAFDVVACPAGGGSEPPLFRQLRLEHGFPRSLPGRG